MKRASMILALALAPVFARAEVVANPESSAQNFKKTLEELGGPKGSYWVGEFTVKVGPASCSGKLQVYFFPGQKEEFTQGKWSVSYRHKIQVDSHNPLCENVKLFSPLRELNCSFPKKDSPVDPILGSNGERQGVKKVPFRTIVPSDDGSVAQISAPLCNPITHEAFRPDVDLVKLELSPDKSKLDVKLLPFEGLSNVTYSFERRPIPGVEDGADSSSPTTPADSGASSGPRNPNVN